MQQWYIIETETEYKTAMTRYEEVRESKKGSPNYREWILLSYLISKYEKEKWDKEMPELDPIELIKIRMEDFGYTATDLVKVYGDKGTVSKVLNYKQALSLTMIRKFSKLLRVPTDALTKEYKIQS
jgi:HTH-type transcriptional regulator/antitoxin HigA